MVANACAGAVLRGSGWSRANERLRFESLAALLKLACRERVADGPDGAIGN